MIIVSYQWHNKVSNPPESIDNSYLSRVLFYCGIDVSRNRFKHFMQSEHRDKVGSFIDVTRITWLYRHHIMRSSEKF